MRPLTSLHRWIRSELGDLSDTTARAALTRYCGLIFERYGDKDRLPVSLAQFAEFLGLEPRPVYAKRVGERWGADAYLDVRSGRIVLRTKDGHPPNNKKDEQVEYFRLRFSYAHELAHAIFYDCSTRPLKRVAPPATGRDEEQVCNYVARLLLMPDALMPRVIDQSENPSMGALFNLINGFHVNLQPAAYRLHEWLGPRAERNEFWMVSRSDRSMVTSNYRRPTCITCMTSSELRGNGGMFTFLAGGQHLDAVTGVDTSNGSSWSLLDFFQHPPADTHWDRLEFEPHDELLQTKKHIVRLRSRHRWIKWGRTAWTQGTIEIVSELKKTKAHAHSASVP